MRCIYVLVTRWVCGLTRCTSLPPSLLLPPDALQHFWWKVQRSDAVCGPCFTSSSSHSCVLWEDRLGNGVGSLVICFSSRHTSECCGMLNHWMVLWFPFSLVFTQRLDSAWDLFFFSYHTRLSFSGQVAFKRRLEKNPTNAEIKDWSQPNGRAPLAAAGRLHGWHAPATNCQEMVQVAV